MKMDNIDKSTKLAKHVQIIYTMYIVHSALYAVQTKITFFLII